MAESYKVGLKEAARGWVPDEILDAPKRGFRLPIHDWLRGELRDYARDVLLDPAAIERGHFNRVYVERLLTEHAATPGRPLPGHLDAAHVRAVARSRQRRRRARSHADVLTSQVRGFT